MQLVKSSNILFLNAFMDELQFLLKPVDVRDSQVMRCQPWQPLVQHSVGVEIIRPMGDNQKRLVRVAVPPEGVRGQLKVVLAAIHANGDAYEGHHHVKVNSLYSGVGAASLFARTMFEFLMEGTQPSAEKIDLRLKELC